MSVEIAWKQNILVTDFQLLKSLLVIFGFGSQASSVDSADKTLTVYKNTYFKLTHIYGHLRSSICLTFMYGEERELV